MRGMGDVIVRRKARQSRKKEKEVKDRGVEEGQTFNAPVKAIAMASKLWGSMFQMECWTPKLTICCFPALGSSMAPITCCKTLLMWISRSFLLRNLNMLSAFSSILDQWSKKLLNRVTQVEKK
jgi:hypothetical protein